MKVTVPSGCFAEPVKPSPESPVVGFKLRVPLVIAFEKRNPASLVAQSEGLEHATYAPESAYAASSAVAAFLRSLRATESKPFFLYEAN